MNLNWIEFEFRMDGQAVEWRLRFLKAMAGLENVPLLLRDAYLDCCSLQTSKKTYFVNLTDYTKDKLESVPNVCNAYRSVVTRRLTREMA